MADYTMDELVAALRESAGEDESIDLDADVLDSSFDDLGYDSLALINTIGAIERGRGVKLPEDILERVSTPRMLLKQINETLAGR